ncbi:hypothetical protein Q8W71_25275 [Methylobacterium sp. NEAU 140]|uniref:hypothetical protein n=1 Tax=Methylobacterium sp. NEAU 140 TaxID=3064945 RepID=UPI002733A2F4|nr:hypothetical protein [Methylobacterium sp. NEAU 140]MDP4025949.1 hypothetical protein [Methylobacterium sp. NEAU 140]
MSQTPYDHPARSIATELVVRVMLDLMERADPAVRGTVLREAAARAGAMTEGMPNAEFFRGRVETALAEIVGTKG